MADQACATETEKKMFSDSSVMTTDQRKGIVPVVWLSTQCTGLSCLFTFSMKEAVWEHKRKKGGVMGTNRQVQSKEQERQIEGASERQGNDCFDWLPAILSLLAACQWRLQRCRKPRERWVCCHWHRWPKCWQSLVRSAGPRLMLSSLNTGNRYAYGNVSAVNKIPLLNLYILFSLWFEEMALLGVFCYCVVFFFIKWKRVKLQQDTNTSISPPKST